MESRSEKGEKGNEKKLSDLDFALFERAYGNN